MKWRWTGLRMFLAVVSLAGLLCSLVTAASADTRHVRWPVALYVRAVSVVSDDQRYAEFHHTRPARRCQPSRHESPRDQRGRDAWAQQLSHQLELCVPRDTSRCGSRTGRRSPM